MSGVQTSHCSNVQQNTVETVFILWKFNWTSLNAVIIERHRTLKGSLFSLFIVSPKWLGTVSQDVTRLFLEVEKDRNIIFLEMIWKRVYQRVVIWRIMDYGNENCWHDQCTKVWDLFWSWEYSRSLLFNMTQKELMRMDIIDMKEFRLKNNLFDKISILGCKSAPNFRRLYVLQTSSTYEAWNFFQKITQIASICGHMNVRVMGHWKPGFRSIIDLLSKIHLSSSHVIIMYGSCSTKGLWV